MKNFLLAVALFPIGTAVAAGSFESSQDTLLKQSITKQCLIDMQEGVINQLEKEGKHITPAGMQGIKGYCKCKGEKFVSHMDREINTLWDGDTASALKSIDQKSQDECFAILDQKRRVKGTKK